MDDPVIQLARQLLDGGFARLSDREQRVITHIAKRQHISRDVNAVQEENQTLVIDLRLRLPGLEALGRSSLSLQVCFWRGLF